MRTTLGTHKFHAPFGGKANEQRQIAARCRMAIKWKYDRYDWLTGKWIKVIQRRDIWFFYLQDTEGTGDYNYKYKITKGATLELEEH